jgi:hypothetical protein
VIYSLKAQAAPTLSHPTTKLSGNTLRTSSLMSGSRPSRQLSFIYGYWCE